MNAPLSQSGAAALELNGLSQPELDKRQRLIESIKRNLGPGVLAALELSLIHI